MSEAPFEREERGTGPSLPDFAAQVERIMAAQQARGGAPSGWGKSNATESPDELRERLRRRLQPKRERWLKRLPGLYSDATLDGLAPQQQPDALKHWLGSEQRTLFLAGAAGAGKTWAAYAIGAAAVDAPAWVEGWNTVELLEALMPGPEAATTLDAVLDCDLLILDDLFAPKVTDWASQMMYRIADKRVNDERRQIITTNGDWVSLVAKWGEPTMDRLGYRSTAVVVEGGSRRSRGW